ncbi:MAG: hypothetical protein JJ858_10920 [Rhizobiaceae bacterium]|nr:hypothetical protein [Rhizobiaceae bacterium]
MSYIHTTKQYLAVWLIVANLMVFTAMVTSLSTVRALSHEDDVQQHLVATTSTKLVDDHLMLDLNLANFSGKTIDVQSLSINGVALRSIDQSLADQASLEVSGTRAIQIPTEYRRSMFLAFELDLGRDGIMTIPVVISN